MASADMETLHRAIQDKVREAEMHIKNASSQQNHAEAVAEGLRAIQQAEDSLRQFAVRSNQFLGVEGNTYRQQQAQLRR